MNAGLCKLMDNFLEHHKHLKVKGWLKKKIKPESS